MPQSHTDEEVNESLLKNCSIYLDTMSQLINQKNEMKTEGKVFFSPGNQSLYLSPIY